MEKHKVTIFKPYEFKAGQKIRIAGGQRRGDWEVIGLSASKVRLRCPISQREFEWPQFCFFVEEKEDIWPQK